MSGYLRLGVNIDHVATIRNARGGAHPDPVRAAMLAAEAGADGITAHLREDRRHISDRDIERLVAEIDPPLNLEMAATEEMLKIALRHQPHAACIVPEKRAEVTTEGGLDAAGGHNQLKPYVAELSEAGIRVSLFIDTDSRQLDAAPGHGAPVVESLGLECHAGHGLTYVSGTPVAAIPNLVELNIGHFLVGEAIFVGFEAAIRRMRETMDAARREAEAERA